MADRTSPRTWPADWEERRAGSDCPMCAEGTGDVTARGELRVLSSAVCDAYLQRTAIVPGYVVAIWRGRHVSEPTELDDAEAAEFDRAVRTVSRAIEAHYRPAKLNFLTMGNAVPHLHVHIVPRYVTDPEPGRPPRFMMVDPTPDEQPPIPEDEYQADVAALRQLMDDLQRSSAELQDVGRVALAAAAAVVDDRGAILLVRHSYGRRDWELPGGVAKAGESPQVTAAREVAEATALTVIPERMSGVYPEPRHPLGPTLHFVFRCRRASAEAEPRIVSDEIVDLGWFQPSDLPRPISDFTIRRIENALAQEAPSLPVPVGRRVWLDVDR